MKRRIIHICLILTAAVWTAVLPLAASAQNFNKVVDVSYVKNPNNVVLKYSDAQGKSRFTFDFATNSKVPYEIRSDEKSTTITFYRLFNIQTQRLTDFPQYDKIMQKKISERGLEITFPLPLASSFEHMNSIILDLSNNGDNGQDKTERKVKPLQISSLSFSWNTPVALSVFKREKYLWIVFNQYQKVDTNELLKNAGSMVKDIIQLPHSAATILRVEAAEDIYSEVRKEGLLWIVDLYNRKTERAPKPIRVSVDTSIPSKPFIQADLPHTEDVFSFLDPEVGDMLVAITSSDAGYAFLEGYTYPDFRFLPSSQGMAVNSDDFGIAIMRNNTGYMLQTTQHPLHISQNLEQLKQREEAASGKSNINLTQDLTVPIISKTFEQSEKFLNLQIKIAPKKEKDRFYVELARFYLSHGLGSNALHTLRETETLLTSLGREVSLRLQSLRAVALFLMSRYEQAYKIFDKPEIKNNPEAVLWHALSDVDGKHDNTKDIVKSLHFIHNYPVEVKRKLLIRGVEYALARENDELAQRFLNIMRELPKDEELTVMMNYFDAEKIKLQGYLRSALPLYKAAAVSSDNKYSALARYRIASFNSQIAAAKPYRTIQEFERLKFSWGEKNFKIKVLNKLVELYLRTGNFYMALKTLDEISSLSANSKSVIEQRMIQIMEEIYYYNNDNQFSPIKALALFDDFGYLISRSSHQTAIILKLADRLVAIDLLDRAYNLLDNYLKANRGHLTHTEISAMGSRMALISLFKNDVSEALRNLSETYYADASETLKLQRKIIKAQAFVRQGKVAEALELIGDDTSKNALLLKAQIYWDTGHWDEVSDTVKLLVEKPKGKEPLSEEQVRYVLDWLTALKQAGKETVIVRVKNTFMPYFEKTPYYSIFSLLTGGFEKDKINMDEIDKTIKDVQTFSDFAKQYTKSLMSGDFSEKDAK